MSDESMEDAFGEEEEYNSEDFGGDFDEDDFGGFEEDDEQYDFEYEESDDDQEDITVTLSNCYYTSKGALNNNDDEAIAGFTAVLDMEQEKGDWGFKALKQLVKLRFQRKEYKEMLEAYDKLLSYIKSAVTRNFSEKVINSLLEFISSSNDIELLQKFYENTLEALKLAKNDRLWFKTNLKLGKLRFQREEFNELSKILRHLRESCLTPEGIEDQKKGTQLLEIYALEIQMYTAQKNNKKLRELYEKSLKVKSAIPHPRIMAVIRECGGKMFMAEEMWEEAQKDFFEAFKNYDEAGSARRIQCLKYMVLANMLSRSEINPFAAPETASYKNDREIIAMTNLVQAYEDNDVLLFEKILRTNKKTIMDDRFIMMYLQDLLKGIRTRVLKARLQPYTAVRIAFMAKELNIPEEDVLSLLVSLILDGEIHGKIDEVNGLLILDTKGQESTFRHEAIEKMTEQLASLHRTIDGKLPNQPR